MDINDPYLMPTRDHIHPKSRGGKMTVWACWRCNNLKGDMTEQQWIAYLAALQGFEPR